MEAKWGDWLEGNCTAPDQRGWGLIKERGSKDGRKMGGDGFLKYPDK